MRNLAKTRFLTIIISLILFASLYGVFVVPNIYALTGSESDHIRLLNAVNVTLNNNRLLYSIKLINTTLVFNSSSCPCCSNTSAQLNYSYITILNESKDHYKFIFMDVAIYGTVNDTELDYTFYLLLYHSTHRDYNTTIVTIIFTDPSNQSRFLFFKTIANIQPISDKAMQVMDIINIMNRTTLSQHYKILAKTLKHLRRSEGVTRWVWTKLSHELNKLSNIVKHELKEYNKQKAYGIGITVDDYWSCVLQCIMLHFPEEWELCSDVCYLALTTFDPYLIALCLACVGVVASPCLVECYFE